MAAHFQSPGLEAPEIHRPPPPPRESKSNSCAFRSGTVTFQGGSFQEKTPGLIGPRSLRILIGRIAVGWPCMECHVPCHISVYWVWDSVKQSEGWGKNPALIARSPTRHSKNFIEKFHHKSSLLVWLPNYFSGIAESNFSAILFILYFLALGPKENGSLLKIFITNRLCWFGSLTIFPGSSNFSAIFSSTFLPSAQKENGSLPGRRGCAPEARQRCFAFPATH